jgi:hypothetical protein
MQLSAVLLARVFLFIESTDLNPRGAAFYPDVIRALVERYTFQKFPQKFEDLDESKGVVFELGKFGKKNIEKVTIYSSGLALDTTSSTRDSEEILEEALTWATEKLGLQYKREMVRRKAYVSQVTFYSGVPLLVVNPHLEALSRKVSEIVSANIRLKSTFAPSGILLAPDPESQTIPVSAFTIERRQGAAYSEGKYFSTAPLPTDIHLSLLEEFEQVVSAHQKKA